MTIIHTDNINTLAGTFRLTDCCIIERALRAHLDNHPDYSPEQVRELADLFRETIDQIARDEFAGDYDYPDMPDDYDG